MSGNQGNCSGREACHEVRQRRPNFSAGKVMGQTQCPSQQGLHDAVGLGLGEGLARPARDPHAHSVANKPELRRESGLAGADRADDLHCATAPRDGVAGALEQFGQLRVPPDEGEGSVDLVHGLVSDLVHDGRVDHRFLPLDEEGLEPGERQPRSAAGQHRLAHDHLLGPGALHQPCRQVHRVSHDRVGPTGLRPEVAGEDDATVDTGAELQTRRGVDDVVHGAHQMLVVVDAGDGDTAGQDELAAVAVDVTREPMDTVPSHRAGRGVGQVLEERSHPLDPLPGNHLVRLLETDERDRRLAVFADAFGLDAQPLLQRDEPLQVRPGPFPSLGHQRVGRRFGVAPQEEASVDGGADDPRGQLLGHPNADLDLTGFGVGLTFQGGRDVGSCQEELTMDAEGQENREVTTVHPDGDTQPHRPSVPLRDRLGDDRTHGVRGPAGP